MGRKELSLLIVDSQVHIWSGGHPPIHHRQDVYGAIELLEDMAEAGVDRAVLVPPTWDSAGNAPSLQAAVDYPDRFAVMGLIDLAAPTAPEQLARWRSQPGMLGVRLSFNGPSTRKLLIDRTADWFWAMAEKLDLPVMMLVPGLLPSVADIALRHPGLRIVVDHLAVPRGAKGPAAFEHMPELLAISRYPNVAVKAAGIPGYAQGEAFPYPSLHEPLRQVFDAFGPERMFWGTDLSRMTVSYRECVEMFTIGLPWLKGDALAQVMGQSLCRWIGWETPVSALAAQSG
jgi:L-fuconolactonase